MLRLAMVCMMGMLWSGEPPYPDDVPVTDGFLPRFPTVKEMNVEDAEMKRLEKDHSPVAQTGKPNPCDSVTPEAQMSCPLTDKVVAVEPIPQGVRLLVHRGLPPDQMRDELICQLSLAEVKADTPPSCTFLGPDMVVAVRPQGKGTTAVEIVTDPPDAARASVLQTKAKTAFPKARKAAQQ
jgi:hypothetical protein